MTKEELTAQGWELYFSGTCDVAAWGKYMVFLRHSLSERVVHGYGDDEQAALNDAFEVIKKPLENTNETDKRRI